MDSDDTTRRMLTLGLVLAGLSLVLLAIDLTLKRDAVNALAMLRTVASERAGSAAPRSGPADGHRGGEPGVDGVDDAAGTSAETGPDEAGGGIKARARRGGPVNGA